MGAGGGVDHNATQYSDRPRIEELTFCRFIAASMVVVAHVGSDVTGVGRFVGPSMMSFFFVLSGFVLGITYFNQRSDVKTYFVSRIGRIVPVYLLALFLMIAYLCLQGRTPALSNMVLNVLMVHAWFLPNPENINGPSWSLSVEAFFYLSFPLVMWLIKRHSVSTRTLFTLSFLLWVVTQIVVTQVMWNSETAFLLGAEHDLVYYWPPIHLSSFLMGLAGAVWFLRTAEQRKQQPPASPLVARLIVWSVVALTVAVTVGQKSISAWLGVMLPFGSSFMSPLFLLLIVTLSVYRMPFFDTKYAKPFIILGEASYGIYILQAPAWYFWSTYVAEPLAIGATPGFYAFIVIFFGLSVFCYFGFEKPMNRYVRKKYSKRAEKVEVQAEAG